MKTQIRNRILINVVVGFFLTLASFGIQEKNSPLGYPKVSAGYPRAYLRDAGGVSVEGSLGLEDHFSLGDFFVDVFAFALVTNFIFGIAQRLNQSKN